MFGFMEQSNSVQAGQDIRDRPRYLFGDAARMLSVPVSTLRYWFLGRPQSAHSQCSALVRLAQRKPPALSFWNVVEAYVLASIRREHKIPMPKVREALHNVQRELAKTRPLIQQQFLTDCVDLFVERYAALDRVSGDGQRGMRELLIASLQRIDRDPVGLARRLSPWLESPTEPHSVQLDPARAFGRLVLAGTGIPTESVAERYRGGESLASLCQDYELTRRQVETALRWEKCERKAA